MSQTLPASRAPGLRNGCGQLTFARIGGKTVVTRMEVRSPLRLLAPRNAGKAAWAYTSSYGGGLLAGDELSLELEAERGSTGYVSSQSSTKVYRSLEGRMSRQGMTARVGEEAFLAVMPDPVVCYAGARYEQRQRVELAASGGLVMLDWFTSGRHGRGERWEAEYFRTSNEIWMEGHCVLRDVLRLGTHGFGSGGIGMGTFNCIATLLLLGRRVERAAGELLEWVKGLPIKVGDLLPIGASPVAGGVIFRIAGVNVEEVSGVIFERLGFLGEAEFLGECPWSRKW